MSKTYKLKSFLRYLSKDLLRKYLIHAGISKPFPQSQKDESDVDCWKRFIGSLPAEETNKVESGFQDVNELADETGIQVLLELAGSENVKLQKEIEGIENQYNQALHCYLAYPTVFESALVLYHVTDLKAKVERTGLKKINIKQAISRGGDLAKELREYFLLKEGRGRHCHVDPYEYNDRICFIAYPEDYLKSDFHYDQKGQFTRAKRRSCFEVVYVYYSNEGKLELSARGGKNKALELFRVFNVSVLEDDSPIDESQKVYDLDKLLEKDFVFPTDSEDEVEYVNVTQMRLNYKYGFERVTIEVSGRKGVEGMHEALGHRGINSKYFHVTQARIKMKFPGKGKKGSVTIQLTAPDKCNLNDTSTHLKAKKYLRTWGLEYRPDIKKSVKSAGSEPSLAAV